MFTLEIETGNAAFETDATSVLAEMLRTAAAERRVNGRPFPLCEQCTADVDADGTP
jgi:hypothetical protein